MTPHHSTSYQTLRRGRHWPYPSRHCDCHVLLSMHKRWTEMSYKIGPFGRNILYCEEAWRCYKPNCDIHCVKWKRNAITSRENGYLSHSEKQFMGVWLVFGAVSDKFRGLLKSLSNLIIKDWGLYRMKTRTLGGECWCLPGPWGCCERRARGMNSGASGLST